jgi:hypothetical protein
VWGAVAEFIRGHAVVGNHARERGLMRARRRAAALVPDAAKAGQVYRMLHLSAALQAASLRRVDDSRDHLAEATATAARTGDGSSAGLMFGPNNVGVWRAALAVELGEGGRVAELADQVDVAAIPSAGRQATFYGDVGRGLAQERGREDQAVQAFRHAEDLAPQRLRTNPYVRAAVTNLLPRTSGQAKPDYFGRRGSTSFATRNARS